MSNGECYNGTLSCRNFFSLFKNSAGKHIGGNKEFYFYHNEDHSKLLLYRTSDGKSGRDEVMGAAAAQPARLDVEQVHFRLIKMDIYILNRTKRDSMLHLIISTESSMPMISRDLQLPVSIHQAVNYIYLTK